MAAVFLRPRGAPRERLPKIESRTSKLETGAARAAISAFSAVTLGSETARLRPPTVVPFVPFVKFVDYRIPSSTPTRNAACWARTGSVKWTWSQKISLPPRLRVKVKRSAILAPAEAMSLSAAAL